MSNLARDVASVAGLWRYPVKSMLGEELNAADVTEGGLLGDRPYALVDAETGKVASAKERGCSSSGLRSSSRRLQARGCRPCESRSPAAAR